MPFFQLADQFEDLSRRLSDLFAAEALEDPTPLLVERQRLLEDMAEEFARLAGERRRAAQARLAKLRRQDERLRGESESALNELGRRLRDSSGAKPTDPVARDPVCLDRHA